MNVCARWRRGPPPPQPAAACVSAASAASPAARISRRVEPGEPHRARARRAGAPRRRADQRRDRTAPVRVDENRRPPRLGDPAQARRSDARPRDRRVRLGGLRAASVLAGRTRSLTSARARPSKGSRRPAPTSVGRAPSAYPPRSGGNPPPAPTRTAGDRMTARRLLCLTVLGILALATAVRVRRLPQPQQAKADGGLVRAGTIRPVRLDQPVRRVQRAARTSSSRTSIPTLVEYDTNFKIEGDWAKSWTTSKDGLTWTFKLKPRQVVGREAADRRRRRLDGQPDPQVRQDDARRRSRRSSRTRRS